MQAPRTGATEAGAPASRWISLDIARGVAILAMVVYHTAWDLSALGLIATEVGPHPGWALLARATAGTFLVLVGASLVLAHRAGIRWRPFGRRLALVAAAAALVTVATVFAFPQSYVFFGILHNIALSSVLALPFLRAPAWLAGLAAALVVALPFWLAPGERPASLDAPLLAFLGLGTRLPVTNDFVPVFPWTGFVLAGLTAMRLVLATQWQPPTWREGLPGRALATLGRHSLLIYLVHQPLIYGALAGLALLLGPRPAVDDARYLARCEQACRAQSQGEARCRAFCACNLGALGDLRGAVMRGHPAPDELDRLQANARQCSRANP